MGQLACGWSSDRTRERLWHTVVPMVCGAIGLGAAVWSRGSLPLTVACFMVAAAGLKSYLPAFWTLPSIFLTGSAAAGSIGLINSIGNLGGFLGPFIVGSVESMTGSFESGLLFLGVSAAAGGLTDLPAGDRSARRAGACSACFGRRGSCRRQAALKCGPTAVGPDSVGPANRLQ